MNQLIEYNYSILINTCDNFEDCWSPFFKLFSIYWPYYKGKIYLNTEYKDFSYPGLNIICTKVCAVHHVPHTQRATWSECLRWALEQIDTDLVLYMQEDYFLKDAVKNDIIENFVSLMYENKEIDCIHLTDQAVRSRGGSPYENLDVVDFKQRYRVSCQAALWRKQELQRLIRIRESAWEFEEFGSKRSSIIKSNYLVVSNNYVIKDKFEIIPYVFTGIIQGRWFEEVIPLFAKHDISIDYNQRGFVSKMPKKPTKERIIYRLRKIPKLLINRIELLKLRISK